MTIAWLLLGLNSVIFVSSYCVDQSTLVWVNGSLSISQTFARCLQNISDPALWPYYDQVPLQDQLIDHVQVSINNLISVDEVSNEVSFDFFFRQNWTDPRLDMPALFEALNRNDSSGIDISPLLLNSYQSIQGYQYGIWVPNNIFYDAVDKQITDTVIKLYPKGLVYISQHIVITLLQSNFKYHSYPDDRQAISMRFASFSLSPEQMKIVGQDPPVDLYSSVTGQESFTLNPIWQYISSSFYVYEEDNGTPGHPRIRSTGVITINVRRYSDGLVYRLAIPIFLLVMLAGISFWGAPVDRMNVSITILLSVSALYIVVFQNIPMIGILTVFDKYVLVMFLILFCCCILHQLIIRFGTEDKIHKWPLRMLYIRALEGVGRTCVIPVIYLVMISFFETALDTRQLVICSFLVTVWTIVIFSRESKATRKAFTFGMQNIASKISALADLSNFEVLLFNRYMYKKWSISLNHHLKELNIHHEEIERLKKRKEELKYTHDIDSDDEVDNDLDDSGGSSGHSNTNHGGASSGSVHSLGSGSGGSSGGVTKRGKGAGAAAGTEVEMTSNPMGSSARNANNRKVDDVF